MIHELKTWPAHFLAACRGEKGFEVRKDDRNFKVGDTLYLVEYDPETGHFSGQNESFRVTYLIHGGQFGIKKGYVVMSIVHEYPQ